MVLLKILELENQIFQEIICLIHAELASLN